MYIEATSPSRHYRAALSRYVFIHYRLHPGGVQAVVIVNEGTQEMSGHWRLLLLVMVVAPCCLCTLLCDLVPSLVFTPVPSFSHSIESFIGKALLEKTQECTFSPEALAPGNRTHQSPCLFKLVMKPAEEQVWPLDCFIGCSSPRSGPGVSTPARNGMNSHALQSSQHSKRRPRCDPRISFGPRASGLHPGRTEEETTKPRPKIEHCMTVGVVSLSAPFIPYINW